jgi:hypothetical protein
VLTDKYIIVTVRRALCSCVKIDSWLIKQSKSAESDFDILGRIHLVLQEVVKDVNFVKARPLNSRLFAVLCEEIQADQKSLLLHSEVRWLSRGKVLKRLVEVEE